MDAGFYSTLLIIGVAIILSWPISALLSRIFHLCWRRGWRIMSQRWQRSVKRDADAGSAPDAAQNQPALWAWPLIGLSLGLLLAWRGSAASKRKSVGAAPALELTKERLLLAYNPLLMRVNALALESKQATPAELAQSYNNFRAEIYAASHLLTQETLQAVAQADACLGEEGREQLPACLMRLRAQIRADHQRLQEELKHGYGLGSQ